MKIRPFSAKLLLTGGISDFFPEITRVLTFTLALLFASNSAIAQESATKENPDATNQADELDIFITILDEKDQPGKVEQLISLPSVSSQKVLKNQQSKTKKTKSKSKEARNKAQERINNLLGNPNSETMPDSLPADLRRVVPPRKPPKPPKPKK